MAQIHSFPPISSPQAQVLILGSMPGVTSLRLRQYYGHPQNAFWKIVGNILGFDPVLGYEQRTAALVRRKLALWDVLAACAREGSLDSSIDGSSVVPNDFTAFFAAHSDIRRVCFNGASAERMYRRHVLPQVAMHRPIELVRLPSTSPAHAGMPLASKTELLQAISP